MISSFAYFRPTLQARRTGLRICLALALGLALLGCASLPPPTAELDAARQAVARADAADADQYAQAAIDRARAGLEAAQAAMARGQQEAARSAALRAAADADLAYARSRAAVIRAEYRQQQVEIAELRTRLGLPPESPRDNPLDMPPPAGTALLRLQALEADPRLNAFARYERLQATQALAIVQASSSRNRAEATAQAERRVGIAEQVARLEAAQREAEALQSERSQLLIQASRRDAERARAEAERIRMQAQVQAEEAARLQAAADAQAGIRQDAQLGLDDAQARLAAAREKQANLARQEAELVAGATLPPSRRDGRGDIFTLSGDAFGSGQAVLTADAAARVRALGQYLKSLQASAVRVIGHTDSQGDADANLALSRRRAESVRAGLVAAGMGGTEVRAEGRGEAEPIADNETAAGRAANRRVEVIVGNQP